jgi:ATP-dependent DNA helicase RecG
LTGIFKLKGFNNMIHPIPEKESLTIEFKSEQKRLPDRDLVAAVVCLVSAEGGEINAGVEKDDVVTGLHPLHQNLRRKRYTSQNQ